MHTKYTTKNTAPHTYIYMYVWGAVRTLAHLLITLRGARALALACVCVFMFLGGAPKADAAITYYNSTSTPVDGGSANEPNTGTITPPTSMTTGDLVFLIAQSDADNMTMSSTGGQSWTEFTSGGAITDSTTYGRVWWARYNGTWSTNPAIDFAAVGGTNPSTVVMHVFRPTDTTKAWFVDQGFTELDFAAAATITITGQTTATSENTVTLAGWLTSDDNSWGTISGTGWVVAGNAQYRNLGGNDQSAAFAYKIQSSAGATGNVALTQTANGNDAGTTFIVTLREQVPTTLSGTLYSDEGSTPITGGKTVAAAIGTTTTSLHSATTDGSGAFSITLDASNTIGPSTPIVLWVDGDSSTRATLFTKASSTNNITGLNLYQNRVIITHEGTSGTSTTISNMSFYDADDDSDIQYRAATSSSGNVLTVFTNQELYVKSGKTFAPGGDVTVRGNASSTSLTDGSLRLTGSATYTAGGATMLAGSFRASSTATFTHNDYVTIFNATTSGKSVIAPVTSLGNVYFSGTKGAFTFSVDATTTNLHIGTYATVTAPSTLVVQGDYVNAGEFIHNSGTVIMATTTTGQLVGGRTATSSPFYNLTLSGNNAVRSGGYYTVPTTTQASLYSVAVDSANGVLYGGTSATANALIVRCVISTGCDQVEDFTVATSTTETIITDMLVDETNGVLYATTNASGFILRCALSTGCDGGTDFTVATDTSPEYLVSLDIDTANQVLYAGSYGTGLVYRCALSTGCDGGTDFILAADLAATGMFGLRVDETNGRLYVASGGTGLVFYCLLSSSCDQTADFSTASDTPETTFYNVDIDDDNGVMYLGAGNNGRLYRCVLSTGCDGVGEYTVPFDHPTEQVIYEVLVDEDNDILYLTTFGAGMVYTCLLATSCDEQTDFIYATNTTETSIRSSAFDTKTDTLYLAGATIGALYICPICHANQSTTTSVTNLTIGSNATYAQNYETRISGNYTNNGVSLKNVDTGTPSMAFVGTSPQTISGALIGSSTLPSLLFTGAGTKTFSNAASTTDVTIGSGAGEVTTPSSFTIAGNLEQGGTLTANASTIYFTGNVGSSTKVGGDTINSSWADSTYEYVWSMIEHNGKLYAGLAQSAGDAEVWEYDGSSWTMIGGDAINSSWADATYDSIFSMASFNGKLYAGLGQHTGEAEVWEYNGSSWTKVGDGINSSWPDATHSRIPTMAVYNDKLYAGLGNTDAEVWEYNGSSWTQVAGDSLNSSWASAAYGRMSTLAAHGGKLYAGLGTAAGSADVWEYNGSSWVQIGGDALNSSWAAATYETVYSFASYSGKLYTGLGFSTNNAEVWEYNGSSWRMVGGDGVYLSWDDGQQNGKEIVYALLPFGGKLYAGLGTNAGDAEVWEYDGSVWQNVAGNSAQNGSWSTDDAYAGVYSLGSYQNALYAGIGGNAGAAEVWRLNPATLSGTLTSNSRLGAVTIDGSRVFSSVASTSHFTVRASSTVTAPAHLTISGDYTNNGTFTSSGTTTFGGTSAQTATGTMTGTSTFTNLVVTNTSATTTFGAPLTVSGNFIASSTSQIKLAFMSNGTTTFANMQIIGTSGNEIRLRSTTDGTQHKLVVTGAYTVNYADIKDSNACGSTGGTLTAQNSIEGTGNTCWTFSAGGGESGTPLILSGTLYSDEGTTPIQALVTIGVAVGTTTTSVHSTTSLASGAWSVNLGTTTTVGTSTPIVIWTDATSSIRAALVTKWGTATTASTSVGYDLYQNRVIVAQAPTATSTTITDMSIYDSDNDSDIQFNASSTQSTLSILNGQGLYIWLGDTFIAPASTTIYGNFTNPGGVFNHGTGTVTFASTSAATISGTTTGSSAFHNVVVNGPYTMSNNASTTNLTINSGGSLTAPSSLTVSGAYINSGTFTNGNTFHFSGAGGRYGSSTGFTFDVAASGVGTPRGIASDGAYFYVADSVDNRVYRYTLSGTYLDSFSTAGAGAAAIDGVDTDGRYLYVADFGDDEIYRFTLSGTFVDSFDTAASGNTDPYGVAIDGTYIYVTDRAGARVYRYTLAGTYQDFFSTAASGNADAVDIATDGTYLYIADLADTEVYRYTLSGAYLDSFDTAASGNGLPFGIAVEGPYLYTTDNGDDVVYQYALRQNIVGTLTGTSDLGDVIFTGSSDKEFLNNASTTNVTITTATVTASTLLTIDGNFTQNGRYRSNGTTTFSGSSAQSLSGSMVSTSTFNNLAFTGAGTKTFSNNASTTNLRIESGSGSVTAPSLLSISGHFYNESTFAGGSGTTTFGSTTVTQTITSSGTVDTTFSNLYLVGSTTKTFTGTTTASNMLIAGGTTAVLPNQFYITGNYTNNGTTTAGNGTTTFSGTSAQTLSGTMIATSTFNNLAFTGAGTKTFSSNASSTNFMIESGSSVSAPSSLTIGGSFRNSGTFTAGATTTLSNTTAQNATGTMTGTNGFNTLVLSGTSTKSFGANASTTNLVIETNATAVLPPLFSISGNYTNNGTTTAGTGTTTLNGTSVQTVAGTMIGASAFYNLEMTNTTGGSSSPAVIFGSAASTTGTLFMRASSSAAFLAGATSTFQNIYLEGSGPSPVFLRSTVPGTQWGMSVPGTQHLVTYVDVRDSQACSGNPDISAVDGTSVDAGGNTCWNFGSAVSISSAANQTFTYGNSATTIETITVIDDPSTPTMTLGNDIRIKIATSTVHMLWDTTDTTATFGGTASGKVSNTVSYEGGGSVLVIDVTTSFAAGDTLTIAGLSFANFTAVNTAATALSLYTGGASDTSADATDSATITIVGSLELGDHVSGQVQDSFSPTTDTGVELYAFRLTPAGESMSVTSLSISIQGIAGVVAGDLTNMTLYRDLNADRNYDAEDVAIGGSGAVSISGQTGSVTFSSTFSATTTQDYILVGDVSNIMPTDSVVFDLSGDTIVATGVTIGASITVTGSASNIQHIKGGGGAGGSSAAAGGGAPAGDGVKTGGSEGGGESIDPNSGSTIGSETGFNAPNANGAPLANSWTNPENAYASDGSYATVNSSASQGYGNFGFSVPSNNTITGIGIKIEASGSTAAGTISARVTWDAGSTFTSYETTGTLNVTDGVYELGGPSNTWGRSWTPSEFSNSTFAIEILGNPSANTISVDAIQVRVYHQATGGGGGGGGRASVNPASHFASVIMAFGSIMELLKEWLSW